MVLLASVSACKPGSREQDQPPPTTAHEPSDRARAMTQAFATELQSTLLAAIEAGGPAHAIAVCKHDAPRITAAQAQDGWTLSRTALRVRNPANAPTDWQRAVLERWQAQLDTGEVEDPATLEWSDTSGSEFRYMRAIPLGGVCLGCHGPADRISAEVKAALAEQYPDDEATGFEVGQLRGAFVITGPA